MRCEVAQRELSARFDGDGAGAAADVDAHVAGCAPCTRFAERMAAARQHLRLEPLVGQPDVAPAVLAALVRPARRPGWHRVAAVAAVFVAGAVAGATFVGTSPREPGSPAGVAFAGVPARIDAAQRRIASLEADVDIVEHGWHPAVDTRVFTGTIVYRAPESLAVALTDRTDYPDGEWVPNDVTLVVDGDRWWIRGPRACPVESLPGCTPPEPTTTGVVEREPFATATPVPLDLVTPVASLALGGDPAVIGTRSIDGRPATGLRTTVARVAPVIDGLRPTGNGRELHPTDAADLWLDEATLVPLALEVRAAEGADRAAWAATRGLDDQAGDVVLEVTLSRVGVNAPVGDDAFPAIPEGAIVRSGGYVEGDGTGAAPVLRPARLPSGFTADRGGSVTTPGGPVVAVQSYTDGRAWITVRATPSWNGGRLFGGLGPLVRRRDTAAGVVYVGENGRQVAVHGDGVDVVVAGSVPTDALVDFATGLGVVGVAVPATWDEAGAGTLDAIPPGLLHATAGGFATTAIRVDGDAVTLAYAGGGDRAFVLVRNGDRILPPPLDPDVRGVVVRGVSGRYSSRLGSLEWVEAGASYSLRSTTLSLPELLAVTVGLEAE